MQATLQGTLMLLRTNETRNSQSTVDERRVDSNSSVGQRARRKAASKALEKISE